MCKLSDYDELELTPDHRQLVKNELEVWHRTYLPPHWTPGMQVVDIGAGCGETAMFYLLHGASMVVCLEADHVCLRMLRNNFASNPRVIIVPVRVDFLKIDIEGSEKNMTIETHFEPYLKRLERVGYLPDGTSVTVWRLGSHDRLSRISAWGHSIKTSIGWRMHIIRIRVAHFIRKVIDRVEALAKK